MLFRRRASRCTPRYASSQRRLAARAFYSRIFCPVTWKAVERSLCFSATRPVNRGSMGETCSRARGAQVDHVRGQPAALVDPAPHLEWIHRIQCLRCLRIGYFAPSGIGIPGCMESEPGTGGHAYPVVRNRTENDGAGRNTGAVDNHPLARTAHALIFAVKGFDPTALVLRNQAPRRLLQSPRGRITPPVTLLGIS